MRKRLVDRFDARPFASAQDGLVEVLQQDVVDLPQQQHVPVVVVHEAFDRQLPRRILVAEALGEFALIVEQQPVFAAAGDQVQAEAHPPEEAPAFHEPLAFERREEAGFHQLRRRCGAVEALRVQMALADPQHGLDVAQAAW